MEIMRAHRTRRPIRVFAFTSLGVDDVFITISSTKQIWLKQFLPFAGGIPTNVGTTSAHTSLREGTWNRADEVMLQTARAFHPRTLFFIRENKKPKLKTALVCSFDYFGL
jgi:hypothetical protein